MANVIYYVLDLVAPFACLTLLRISNLSLTLITLTVCAIYTTVFEYQNQGIFNVTVFDG
jgi:hypothetical protein